MGRRNADNSRGVDRPPLEKVERETLLAMLKAANETIEKLQAQARNAPPLDNDLLQATGYKTEVDEDEGRMRISFHHGAVDNVIAWMILPTVEVYALASKALECYDKLEGIK
jgi:hypothetical protein